MDVTKPYKFIGLGVMDVTKPYKLLGFGAMDVTKSYAIRGDWGHGCHHTIVRKDRRSVILTVWVLAKEGGRSPPPFGTISGAPGAAQTPKMTDFRPLTNLKFPPKVQPRIGLGARESIMVMKLGELRVGHTCGNHGVCPG
jgi:hypothetical protein